MCIVVGIYLRIEQLIEIVEQLAHGFYDNIPLDPSVIYLWMLNISLTCVDNFCSNH